MEKKFHKIIEILIGMGYVFNREWTINTTNHQLENVKMTVDGKEIFALRIDGDFWLWEESLLDSVIVELNK